MFEKVTKARIEKLERELAIERAKKNPHPQVIEVYEIFLDDRRHIYEKKWRCPSLTEADFKDWLDCARELEKEERKKNPNPEIVELYKSLYELKVHSPRY